MITHFAPSHVRSVKSFLVWSRYTEQIMNSAKGYSVFIQVLMYSFLYVPNNGKRLIETTPTLIMFSKKLARNNFMNKKGPHRLGS